MRKKLITIVATICVVTLAFVACSDDSSDKESTTTTTEAAAEAQSITEIAAGNPDFSILVGLVNDAGLTELLSGAGEYTVFAPTNEAFETVDAATLEALKANKDALTQVLTYHAVSGEVLKSGDFTDGQKLTTASTGEITVGVADDKVSLTSSSGNSVNVVQADIVASNGVIHVIDGVLIPTGLAL